MEGYPQLITGIINAKNEESNIDLAITSLRRFVDEVLVADMASTDQTVAIARSLGARVISVEDYGLVEPAKQAAVNAATFDWVMLLDADEVVPRSLAVTLRELVEQDRCDAVLIPFRTFMFGDPMAHTGWGPKQERHLRLFRRNMAALPTETHTEVRLTKDARLRVLSTDESNCVRHYNYLDWSHFVSKMNRYTSLEATHVLQHGRSYSTASAVRGAIREVVWRYVYRAGYREGLRGLTLTVLMMAYRLLVIAKAQQVSRTGDREDIRRRYRQDAANVGIVSPLPDRDRCVDRADD